MQRASIQVVESEWTELAWMVNMNLNEHFDIRTTS
jgi:hypothetical protein